MTHDYRRYLKAIGRRPVDPDRLRTAKAPGTVEIVRDRRQADGFRLYRYSHPALED